MSTQRMFAIDLGASGGKCFVGTMENGLFSMKELHRFAHEGVSFYAADASGKLAERTHWDDTLLYHNIITGLQAYRRDVSNCLDSIGIDTWGADGAMITADGDLIGKIYCYRDHRLDNMIDAVKGRIDAKRVYEITGIHFQPYNVSNQLHWFAMNRKDMLKKVACFLPIPTVFYHYLGGVRQVDSAWASVTQLMDAKKRKWSREMLKALEIPARIMPEIVAPGTVVGEIFQPLADSIGINRARLVAVGAHDTACAFAAAPVANPDDALIISSGTWSLVGKLIPKPITNDAAMAASVSNEGGIGNIRFLKNCMGSWLVQELRRVWRKTDGKEMAWKDLDNLTMTAKPFAALIDPDDSSFYNPANMEAAIADFCTKTGQSAPKDRGSYARTVYESLALKYRMVNEQICSVCGTKSKAVHIVGGGGRNKLLNQLTADSLNMPVLAGPEEATAVGNLMVQAMGLGIIKSMREVLPIVKQAFPISEFKPQSTTDWEKAYERFRKIAK
jgi:rhamnulokinase